MLEFLNKTQEQTSKKNKSQTHKKNGKPNSIRKIGYSGAQKVTVRLKHACQLN
jgi:hypothetical protein